MMKERGIAMDMNTKDKMNALKALSLISQVGIIMFICIAVSVWGGKYLDDLLGGKNIVFIICILLGILAGFMNIYKLLTKGMRK